MRKRWQKLFLLPILIFIMAACESVPMLEDFGFLARDAATADEELVVEGAFYNQAQDVVNYLEAYGELPPNYLTKKEAIEMGWKASEGNLWEVAPHASIGGDYFGNFEELLPKAVDRDYYEADINYEGGHRNAERLVFSDDGLYYYSDDHYKSFEEMYPEGERQ